MEYLTVTYSMKEDYKNMTMYTTTLNVRTITIVVHIYIEFHTLVAVKPCKNP